MKKKTMIRTLFTLLLVMLFALSGLTAFADSKNVQQAESQLNTIFATLSSLQQPATGDVWRYAVTDLNHNGQLEVIAASLHADRATNVKIWELNADGSAFQELKVSIPEGESFPDLIADSADTYHDTATDTWAYIFHDKIVLSEQNVFTVVCSVTLKDGVLGFNQLAIENADASGGRVNTTYTDSNGFPISADAYNSAGVNAYATAERSNTAFGWFRPEDITEVANLANSYAVFTGEKELGKSTPRPTATLPAAPAPAPAPSAAPVKPTAPTTSTRPAYLSVTKNPTNENRKVGDRALFVANANAFDSLTWTFVSPNGGEYTPETFQSYFGSAVSGNYSTTLAVNNVKADMNGWGAYCTFYYNGQSQRTSTAYLYVKNANTSVNTSNVYGSMSGTVYDIWSNVYRIYLSNGTSVQVSRSKCNIYGDLYDGCSCTVYYVAYASGSYDIYSVDIYGDTTVNPYSYDIDVYDPYAYSYGYYGDNTTTQVYQDGSSQTLYPDGSMTGVTADGYRIESDPYGYFDIYDPYGNVIGGGYDEDFISNG